MYEKREKEREKEREREMKIKCITSYLSFLKKKRQMHSLGQKIQRITNKRNKGVIQQNKRLIYVFMYFCLSYTHNNLNQIESNRNETKQMLHQHGLLFKLFNICMIGTPHNNKNQQQQQQQPKNFS